MATVTAYAFVVTAIGFGLFLIGFGIRGAIKVWKKAERSS